MAGKKATLGLLTRIFGGRDAAAGLYAAIVARGRAPHWYVEGAVADTIDGRFDMIAAILSLVLLRLEAEPGAEALGVALAAGRRPQGVRRPNSRGRAGSTRWARAGRR